MAGLYCHRHHHVRLCVSTDDGDRNNDDDQAQHRAYVMAEGTAQNAPPPITTSLMSQTKISLPNAGYTRASNHVIYALINTSHHQSRLRSMLH